MALIRSVLAAALVLAGTPGCGVFTHSCTSIGCIDGVELTVMTADGQWAAGRYTVELTPEGDLPRVCSGELPEPAARTVGAVIELPCGATPGVGGSVFFEQVARCAEQRTDDAVSQSCTPIPGRLTLRASLQQTPRTLRVRVERGGTVLLDQAFSPEYEQFQPNGEDCEPTCRTARRELSVP